MAAMREQVKRLLLEEIPTMVERGRPSASIRKGSATTFLGLGRGADYITARLKRDDPELAEKVIRGELGDERPRAATPDADFGRAPGGPGGRTPIRPPDSRTSRTCATSESPGHARKTPPDDRWGSRWMVPRPQCSVASSYRRANARDLSRWSRGRATHQDRR